jgi:hypothetical protein
MVFHCINDEYRNFRFMEAPAVLVHLQFRLLNTKEQKCLSLQVQYHFSSYHRFSSCVFIYLKS